MRILLTEDDHAISDGLCYTLGQEGYSVAQAYTLSQARTLLERESFDLALLDLNLPDGSGYGLCGEIKGKSDIPVVQNPLGHAPVSKKRRRGAERGQHSPVSGPGQGV